MLSQDDPRVQILKTAFITYSHTDLAKAREYLLDFGLVVLEERAGKEIFFRGFGSEPFI